VELARRDERPEAKEAGHRGERGGGTAEEPLGSGGGKLGEPCDGDGRIHLALGGDLGALVGGRLGRRVGPRLDQGSPAGSGKTSMVEV